jgi:hypothetical protein
LPLTSVLILAASTQRRECLFFKKVGRIYNKMSSFELLRRHLGGHGWENAAPHAEFGAPPPKWPKKRLRRSPLGGGEGQVEMLSLTGRMESSQSRSMVGPHRYMIHIGIDDIAN